MAKAYGRHRPAEDEIYCALMAERTGESPDNYRARPFDADLLDYRPQSWHPRPWPPIGFPIQNFGPHPQPEVVAWEGTGNDARPVYRKVSDAPQA